MTKCAICGGDIPDRRSATMKRIQEPVGIEIEERVLPLYTLQYAHPHCHAGYATAAEEHVHRVLPVYWFMKPVEQEAILREVRGDPQA